MKGFKSFADPTVLSSNPGSPVVVRRPQRKRQVQRRRRRHLGVGGPRGRARCARRRWRTSSLRGLRRGPSSGAPRVSLTIDNSSGKPLGRPLRGDDHADALSLGRRQEYAINGAPCRLLDIQELLSDSGVGRQQHMIIGQGQLDTVLNARPEDRRAIIEEAAGVRHRRRRRAGRAPLGGDGREPRAPGRPGPRGAPSDPPPGAPGRGGPQPRRRRLRAPGRAPLPGRRRDGRVVGASSGRVAEPGCVS